MSHNIQGIYVDIINSQSTVPPLRSSLLMTKKISRNFLSHYLTNEKNQRRSLAVGHFLELAECSFHFSRHPCFILYQTRYTCTLHTPTERQQSRRHSTVESCNPLIRGLLPKYSLWQKKNLSHHVHLPKLPKNYSIICKMFYLVFLLLQNFNKKRNGTRTIQNYRKSLKFKI